MGNGSLTNLTSVSVQCPIGTKRVPTVGDMWFVEKKTTAVLNGATYTGLFVECRHFNKIVGTSLFDQSGTLRIEQSNDGYIVHYSTIINTVLNVIDGFSVDLICPFVRVAWINGAIGDTTVNKLFAHLKV